MCQLYGDGVKTKSRFLPYDVWGGRVISALRYSPPDRMQAASHELRSPLTALRTGFGVLRAALPEDRRTLELMSGEADRMSKLVDELLLLAGGGSLRRYFQPRPVELDTILIDFAGGMTPVAERKGVYLKV